MNLGLQLKNIIYKILLYPLIGKTEIVSK